MKHNKRGILVVISGFSGAGKSTLVKKLIQDYKNYALSVSMTTRKPRSGEEEGKEYFFVSRENFEETIANQGLVEYAEYCDNYYGTPKEYVSRQLTEGKDVILEIEQQGALKIKAQYPNALLLFVMPPSAAELRKRLVNRGTETKEVIHRRMVKAYEESCQVESYDYIVVNDDFDSCVKRLHAVIAISHDAAGRNREMIKTMREELKGFSEGE